MISLHLATPALLQQYGIQQGSINPAADVLTSRTSLSGYELLGIGRAALRLSGQARSAAR
jgi:hypothetical protein